MVICCKFRKNLFNLWLYTSFHDLINVYSRRSGADNPRGQNLMSTETSCHFGHLLQVSKISLKSDLKFIHFFHDYLHAYSPGQGLTTPWGRNFDASRNILSVGSFVASFKKISLMSDFIQFFHYFIHVYKQDRGRQPPGDKVLMSTEMSCHFIHLLQVSKKKKSLWSRILYIFFYDLIHVCSPGAGADTPQGTKFWCQEKGLITLPICCKFQTNLFDFIQCFSWFNTCT